MKSDSIDLKSSCSKLKAEQTLPLSSDRCGAPALVVQATGTGAVLIWILLLCLSIALSGCTDQPTPIKRKTTDQIGEFNPNEGQQVVKPDVRISNPITGPLEAYDPILQQLATLGIDHAVGLFHAEEGRYPNSHEEFMTRVIKNNNIRLPGLPAGLQYQYDLENHKLVIVKTSAPAPAAQ